VAWSSGRAIRLHVTAAVVVPGCLALGWWQLTRALGGNTLSWAYTFEWPVFAGYALYMWWRLLHDADAPAPDAGTGRRTAIAGPTAGPLSAGARSVAGDPPPAWRGAVASVDGAGPEPPPVPGAHGDLDADDDEELAAYNRYLAALHASGRRKRW